MKKIIFSIFMIILLMFTFTGCGEKKDTVITIPLVTWGGYAAMVAANNGAQPTEDSLFYKYGKFKLKLIQAEDPATHLTGFVKGDYPIMWSTVDMLPLIYESLSDDPKTVPKIIGLFDYSAGGDGIIVRGDKIKTGADFKGKKIVTAQYTPSHFFILWYLNASGVSPDEVNFVYVEDAILAKDTYINDDSIDVCVTWSPFIYDITDPNKDSYIPGSVLYMTSAKGEAAYGVVADVFLARADFVEEHPEMLEAFTKAMIEGYDIWMNDKEKVAGEIADLFGLKGGKEEVMLMFGDVTIGSKEENAKLFDKSHEFCAYNLVNLSTELYKEQGKLENDFNMNPDDVIADQFMLKAIK